MVKVLDAHFGRILSLVPYTTGPWNSVITSSIDRTVKVWNMNNVFEQVHVIDRHELQIDSIRKVSTMISDWKLSGWQMIFNHCLSCDAVS